MNNSQQADIPSLQQIFRWSHFLWCGQLPLPGMVAGGVGKLGKGGLEQPCRPPPCLEEPRAGSLPEASASGNRLDGLQEVLGFPFLRTSTLWVDCGNASAIE